ncbi:MAG: rplI [Candidatus Parcubacteria bacterium]|nr:rplI [Candidatus Parcubacteria bacterium]
MKVILLKDIAKIGRKFDIKEISGGHAQNLLIPQGLAVAATPEAVKRVEIQKKKALGDKKVMEDIVAKNVNDLNGITLSVTGKANEKGNLFAGLHREAIADELLKQTQLQIDPSFIQLEHPIKEVGTHAIEVKVGGKSAKFNLIIEAK